MTQQQIHEFVQLAQNGDQTAFGKLYDEFALRIYRYVQLKIPDQHLAEDTLQEIFLKAWVGIPKLQTKDLNFSAWLYKVATNTINDIYRKKYRTPQITNIETAEPIASKDNPPQELDRKMTHQFLHQAITKLNSKYKQILELKFIEDFSTSEIANILDTNTVTVRVWQHRAIKELEKIYKQHERLT